MAHVSPFLISICLYAYLFSLTTAQLAVISELCPYSTFCTKGPLKTLTKPNDTTSCCLPCSCEDDCYLFGNCCPDKPDPVIDEEAMFPCRYQDEIYNGYLQRNASILALFELKIQYRVVDRCPPDVFDGPSLQEAVFRCHRATDMEDLVFVSDVITDRVYLNKYCAQCNGVQNFVEWSLQVTCEGLFNNDFTELDEMKAFIFDHCSILSLPPKQIGSASMCIKNSIKICQLDSSSNRQHFEQLERNCATYDMPYFDGGFYFANVFCFLCSTPPGRRYAEKCSAFENGVAYGDMFFPIRDMFFPISALIRFREENTVMDDTYVLEGLVKCPSNEIFNPITIKCTKLLCPKGTLPSYGSCVTIVGDVSGFGVTLLLGIRLPGTTRIQDDPQAFLDSVQKSFVKKLRSRKLTCGLSKAYISLQANGDALLEITMYSKERCHYIDLLHAFAEIVKHGNIVVGVDGRPVTLSTYIVDLEDNKIVGANALAHTEQLELWHSVVFTKETVHCPSIEFSRLELESSTYHDSVINATLKRADEIDKSGFRICTKYLYDKNASTGLKKSMSVMAILLVVTEVYWNVG